MSDRADVVTGRRRWGWRAAGALVGMLLMLVGGRVQATTVSGTLITNVVSFVMDSGPTDFVVYKVSYNATAWIEVVNPPSLAMAKYTSWAVASAGTTVKFTVCIVNETDNSVWGVTITDKIPLNMAFIDRDGTWNDSSPYVPDDYYVSYQSPPDIGALPGVTLAWNASEIALMTAGSPAPGDQNVYLRWTLDFVGPVRSACVTYRVTIL